jgi:hypothetical protein
MLLAGIGLKILGSPRVCPVNGNGGNIKPIKMFFLRFLSLRLLRPGHYWYVMLLIMLSCFGQGRAQDKAVVTVERWRTNNYKSSKQNKDVYEVRQYDQLGNLVNLKELDPGKKQVIDSIVFAYDAENKLVEQVEYVPGDSEPGKFSPLTKTSTITYLYNKDGALIDVKGVYETVRIYERKHLTIDLKDSLKLLEYELADIDIVASNAVGPVKVDEGNLGKDPVKKSYTAGFRLENMARYGIPRERLLKRMDVYHTSGRRIIKDEFFFENATVRREYVYSNNLIKEIKVSVKEGRSHTIYLEGFTYKRF